MPAAREYGWDLRSTSSSHFEIYQRNNGQFCVVLNHALLRGVRAEMLHWWFLNFPNLRVKLIDIPGYERTRVPAYLLWHPIDHYNATLSGTLGPNNTARQGASILIQEAMQYDRFGWKYPVDTKVKIFYVGSDGWAMGRTLPLFGPVMMLRIHFKDITENGQHIGVHYHYEVVIGVSADNMIARQINKRISAEYGPEFFDAWHRHNVIEVGVFENFLRPLFAQKDDLNALEFRREMDAKPDIVAPLVGYDRALFEERLAGFKNAANPYHHQAFDRPSFL